MHTDRVRVLKLVLLAVADRRFEFRTPGIYTYPVVAPIPVLLPVFATLLSRVADNFDKLLHIGGEFTAELLRTRQLINLDAFPNATAADVLSGREYPHTFRTSLYRWRC